MNFRIASSEGYEELISAEVGGRPSTVSVDWPLLRFIRLPAVRVDPFSVGVGSLEIQVVRPVETAFAAFAAVDKA